MERISIPIKKVTSGFSLKTFLAATLTTLLVGVFTGISLEANSALPLPFNVRSILGAVGETTIEQDAQATPVSTPATAELTSTETPAPTAGANPQPEELLPATTGVASASSAQERAQLETTITEKAGAIEQNTKEIERIKNESILLIAEFNQSCGNWDDDCAVSYRDILETNNTLYETLLITQRALYRELANTQQALIEAE